MLLFDFLRTQDPAITPECAKVRHPQALNVNDHFESAVGLANMSSYWKWAKMTMTQASKKLNDFVSKQGDIAHRWLIDLDGQKI